MLQIIIKNIKKRNSITTEICGVCSNVKEFLNTVFEVVNPDDYNIKKGVVYSLENPKRRVWDKKEPYNFVDLDEQIYAYEPNWVVKNYFRDDLKKYFHSRIKANPALANDIYQIYDEAHKDIYE